MKKILLLALPLVLAGGLAAGYLLWLRPHGAQAEPAGRPAAERAAEGVPVKLGEFTTNLEDGLHMIQVDVDLWVKDKKALKSMEERASLLRDAVVGVLRATSYEDVNGRGGMDRLRQRLLERTRAAGGEAVTGVYFNKLIVQ